MESNGIEGRITVSETTKKLLQKVFPDSFGYEFHKEIHLPSFNELVQMFQIFEKRKED